MCTLNKGIVMLLATLLVSPAWADLESTVSHVVLQKAKLDIQMKRQGAQKKLIAADAKESNSLSAKTSSAKAKATAVAQHSIGVVAKDVSAHLAISPSNSKPIARK